MYKDWVGIPIYIGHKVTCNGASYQNQLKRSHSRELLISIEKLIK